MRKPSIAAGPAPEGLLTCEQIDWHAVARRWFNQQKLRPGPAVVVQGNNRLEVIDLVLE